MALETAGDGLTCSPIPTKTNTSPNSSKRNDDTTTFLFFCTRGCLVQLKHSWVDSWVLLLMVLNEHWELWEERVDNPLSTVLILTCSVSSSFSKFLYLCRFCWFSSPTKCRAPNLGPVSSIDTSNASSIVKLPIKLVERCSLTCRTPYSRDITPVQCSPLTSSLPLQNDLSSFLQTEFGGSILISATPFTPALFTNFLVCCVSCYCTE